MGAADDFAAVYSACCAAIDVQPCALVLDAISRVTDPETHTRRGVDLRLRGESLALFERRLHDEDVQALAAAVRETGIVISVLDLSNNELSDGCANSLEDLLLFGQIEEFCIAKNKLTCDGLSMILQIIESGRSSLQALDVSCNPLERDGGMRVARFIVSDRALRHLNLSSCELETDSLIAIATALRENSSLEAIGLDNPRTFSHDDEITVHIASMLQVNATLQELTLRQHRMRCSGASILADAILSNSTLRSLDLACNEISVEGAEALARVVVAVDCHVESLLLGANRVANDGAAAIGAALEFTNCLRELDLSNNRISDEGLSGIAMGLAVNSSLAKLKLWGNLFGPSSSKLFYQLVEGRFKHLSVALDFLPHVPEDRLPESKECEEEVQIAQL